MPSWQAKDGNNGDGPFANGPFSAASSAGMLGLRALEHGSHARPHHIPCFQSRSSHHRCLLISALMARKQ